MYKNECHICGFQWVTETPDDQCPRCGDYDTISSEVIGA